VNLKIENFRLIGTVFNPLDSLPPWLLFINDIRIHKSDVGLGEDFLLMMASMMGNKYGGYGGGYGGGMMSNHWMDLLGGAEPEPEPEPCAEKYPKCTQPNNSRQEECGLGDFYTMPRSGQWPMFSAEKRLPCCTCKETKECDD